MNNNLSKIFLIVLLSFTIASSNVLASSVNSSENASLTSLADHIISPKNYQSLSPLYEVRNNGLERGRTFYLNLNYEVIDGGDNQVLYFNKNKNSWIELPSWTQADGKIKVEIPFTYVRLAVFNFNPNKINNNFFVDSVEESRKINKEEAPINKEDEINQAELEQEEFVVKDNNGINFSSFDNINDNFSSNTNTSTNTFSYNDNGVSVISLSDAITSPWNYQEISPLYEVRNNNLEKGKTFSLELPYHDTNNYHKSVLYFDKNKNSWQLLPTIDNPAEQKVKVEIPFSYVRLAVFSNENILTVGRASWYKYKNGLFAASPDFAKGSVLRVYNLDNNKHVDVVINDYGPERNLFPDRVIDLDKVAFAKIANTGAGIINVRVEAIKATLISSNDKLQASSEPIVSASSAIILDEKTGAVLWGKEADKVAPLASLTKLVAAKVFLDTKPDLNKEVSYKEQDEKYNYEYCKPGEPALLRVKEGETMTIKDLLYSALVGSANNAVESLVRVSDLSREQFIAKMNEDVKVMGAKSTKFVEPTGLSPDNMSSPYDYAIITKEILVNPLLANITTTVRYSFSTINTKIKHTIYNTDKLLAYNKLAITGSKTGYLDEAGYCLMTRTSTKNGSLIVVNFNSKSKQDNFNDNEKLILYGTQLLSK